MKNDFEFLGKRLKRLREENGVTMAEMASRLHIGNKSSISRAEAGKVSYKTIKELALLYCREFQLDKLQTELFMRGERFVIPDTSTILRNTQIIDELSEEYSRVVIPNIVIDELRHIKDKGSNTLAKKAWQVICNIGYGEKILEIDYKGNKNESNDCKIIWVAKKVSQEFNCKVDIITNDVDYSAYLRGEENINAISLREYRATKQQLVNISKLKKIDKFYDYSYDKCPVPDKKEVNAYFNNGRSDGVTLIISTVRNRCVPIEQRKAKIKWLIKNGADVNKRDCNNYYFPPLSHAAQMGDYEMFKFLLKDCGANPNVGSLNPHSAVKLRQKNEGNMPLMIVCFHTKAEWNKNPDYEKIVRLLCEDKRTSLNQQDGNGFTALIKACANGNGRCRDILVKAGADRKIVDFNGKDYLAHWKEYSRFGAIKNHGRNQSEEKR